MMLMLRRAVKPTNAASGRQRLSIKYHSHSLKYESFELAGFIITGSDGVLLSPNLFTFHHTKNNLIIDGPLECGGCITFWVNVEEKHI